MRNTAAEDQICSSQWESTLTGATNLRMVFASGPYLETEMAGQAKRTTSADSSSSDGAVKEPAIYPAGVSSPSPTPA